MSLPPAVCTQTWGSPALSQGCSNTLPQTQWPSYFLTALEAKSPNSKRSQSWLLLWLSGRGHFTPLSYFWLPPASFDTPWPAGTDRSFCLCLHVDLTLLVSLPFTSLLRHLSLVLGPILIQDDFISVSKNTKTFFPNKPTFTGSRERDFRKATIQPATVWLEQFLLFVMKWWRWILFNGW